VRRVAVPATGRTLASQRATETRSARPPIGVRSTLPIEGLRHLQMLLQDGERRLRPDPLHSAQAALQAHASAVRFATLAARQNRFAGSEEIAPTKSRAAAVDYLAVCVSTDD